MTDSLDVAEQPITIHRHVHAPPPLAVTERNCEAQGFSVRGWRKLCRAALAAGFPASEQSDGWCMLRADVEAFLRAGASSPAAPPPPVDDFEAATLAAAARAGLRVVGGGR